jgi:GNAT superfamily N-acetyltransferase
MPVVDDPDRPRGRLLVGADGAPLARFLAGERDGRPNAERFATADGVAPERVVAAVLADLTGWHVSAQVELGRRLIAAGARPRRHVHVMSRDLVRDPAPSAWLAPDPPEGLRLTPVDRPPGDLAPASLAAFPPDHPDQGEIQDPAHPERELEDIISGELMGGPLLRCSGLAVREDGAVAGAILVNGTPGHPPFGGPWISNVFRHPDARGAGQALLRRALAIATRDGLPALGLAVSHGNPARAVYAAFGFADVFEGQNVVV